MVKAIDKWVKKYEDRASVAEDAYRDGVQNPRRPPASSAIAARDAWVKKLAMKETQDAWEDGLRTVGDAGVIDAAVKKGSVRYVDGVRAGVPKVRDFATKFAAHLEAGQKKVLSMPKVTLQDGINRATEMIKHNANFKYKKVR